MSRSRRAGSLEGKRIWVTGASSGIGQALADLGSIVVVSGRSEERLQDTLRHAPDRMHSVAFDITDREATLQAANRIDAMLGGIDVAVLNAGTCEYVDLPAFDGRLFERVFAPNFFGVVYSVEAALPLLRKSETPYLVGMSSTVAYIGLPRAEAYGASKAAIRYLFQSLRVDLLREHIDVSVIYPGFVKTPLTDKNDFPMPMIISADASARYIIKGMQTRKLEIAFPPLFSFLMRFGGSLPGALRTRLLAAMIKNV
jgi:NAD(P)-dependent dehydrogenase (short-subunit alcohol dehydrogenase family)